MSTIKTVYVTLSCDGPECGKTVTFEATQEIAKQIEQDNPWLQGMRHVKTSDGREFGYCSDECEIKSVGAGTHNKLEVKHVVADTNTHLAALAAQKAAKATAAIKAGQPVTL